MEYFTYLTNDCNLHCKYCSVLTDCQKNNLPIRPMYSNNEYLTFIDRIQSVHDDNEVNIYFFGGEPSLEYERSLSIVRAANETLAKKYQLGFVLHTNGLLLHKMPDELSNTLTLIMFSINFEKFPKHHLANSYFQSIIDNSMIIKLKKNIPMIARLTITEETSVYSEIMQISHFFDLIYWQIENCNSFSDFESFYSSYTYEISLLYTVWLDYFERGIMLKLIPFMAVIKFMFFHDRSSDEFSCGYRKGMIYIQTNGNCYACSDNVEEGKHHIGSLQSGIQFDPIPLSSLKCTKCDYRNLCMGRCGRMHIEFDASHIDEYCRLNQSMFDLFLADRPRLQQAIERYPYYEKEVSDPILEYTEFTP